MLEKTYTPDQVKAKINEQFDEVLKLIDVNMPFDAHEELQGAGNTLCHRHSFYYTSGYKEAAAEIGIGKQAEYAETFRETACDQCPFKKHYGLKCVDVPAHTVGSKALMLAGRYDTQLLDGDHKSMTSDKFGPGEHKHLLALMEFYLNRARPMVRMMKIMFNALEIPVC